LEGLFKIDALPETGRSYESTVEDSTGDDTSDDVEAVDEKVGKVPERLTKGL
jgi:hypothetical protein